MSRKRLSLTAGLLLAASAVVGAAGERQTPTLLVVGDSISAAYRMPDEQGWVALLAERLGSEFRVVNASISGDTTGGGLARLPRALAVHRPDVVVIELGGNDGLRGYPVDEIRANLLAMIEAVLAAGATPLLAGMQIPPNYGRYAGEFHEVFLEVADRTGAALVPFILEGVATDLALMQDDLIHPTAAAQPRLLDNVWAELAPLLDAAGGDGFKARRRRENDSAWGDLRD